MFINNSLVVNWLHQFRGPCTDKLHYSTQYKKKKEGKKGE